MKTLAFVFCYERPRALALCADSLLNKCDRTPDEICFIDDGSGPEVHDAIREVVSRAHPRLVSRDGVPCIILHPKTRNLGFSDSAVYALAQARTTNPEYLFLIEGDYVFRQWGIDTVMDVFENTEQGRMCLGISGYDNPCYYNPVMVEEVFPRGMLAQMGEDNVNRAALHRPVSVSGKRFPVQLELVSNTCFTSYLNWHRIQEVAAEFPELHDYLDQACAPRDNPNYPTSGHYKAQRVVDDGMLSHGISLVWNRWAIKHGIDRTKFGAWLNIKPSVANHIAGGGMNNPGRELETNASSPTWEG